MGPGKGRYSQNPVMYVHITGNLTMANQSEMATIGAFLSQNANTTLLDGVSMRSSGKLTVIYLFFLSIYKFDLGSVTTNTFQ